MSPGDEVYARGPEGMPLGLTGEGQNMYRIFRTATPLVDPVSKEVLGYEAQYVGKAELRVEETPQPTSLPLKAVPDRRHPLHACQRCTLHMSRKKCVPTTACCPNHRASTTALCPTSPTEDVEARVVGLYTSNAMRYGTQHQVVSINKGEQDGMHPGHGALPGHTRQATGRSHRPRAVHGATARPSANGTGMVFRVFDRVSYVLVMDTRRGVQGG